MNGARPSPTAAMDIRQIMQILPHRYPLLLIDRIIEIETGRRAVGIKNVTFDEAFFSGHFPGNPVMPGVFIIEAMAQLGGTTVLHQVDMHRRIAYLAGIDRAKFRRPVVPGDTLVIEAEVIKTRGNIGWVAANARVDGKVVASAQLTYSIVDDAGVFALDAPVLHL
jgi:3-hydroxyacyl-[acyl-carrier-protein] dehydratase